MAAKYLNWADGKCADTVFEARFDYNHATSIDTVPYFVEYYVMDDDGAYPARPVRSYASILQNVREGSLYDIPERAIGKTTAGYDLSFLEPGKADATLGVEPIEGFKAQRYALDEERTTMQVTYEAGSPSRSRCTCRSAWAFASRRAPMASCRLKAPMTWPSRPPRPLSTTC